MIAIAIKSAGKQAVLGITEAGRAAFRFLVLSTALLCYGSVPSTASVQTEYEAQLQEELASHASTHCDLKTRLRGAAQRRAGVVVIASGHSPRCGAARLTGAKLILPQLSCGLSLPLRC